MSDAARAARWRPSFKVGSFLSGAGRAGPRRLVIIGVGGIALLVLVVAVVMGGHKVQPFSSDARMAAVDALPGGLHSTPEQDALAQEADTAHAQQALSRGTSYTPPLAPSATVVPAPPTVAKATPPVAPPAPHFVPHPVPPIVRVDQPVFPPQVMEPPAAAPATPAAATPQPVSGTANPKAVADYSKQIGNLFSQWGGRAPQTDVVLPPSAPAGTSSGGQTRASGAAVQASRAPAATPVSAVTQAQDPETVLIPAGRGVYAHPILALSSDQTSPVVLQADSGPIAGDRMIGSFERQHDRLVIHINRIIHQGRTIGCDGVVVAPDTMEAAVATGVDQHIVSRIILPAAAAFIQGLGQALATTSNTVSVLSPLGGATTATNLNFHQQLGVAAGVAAGQVGSVLNQEAPKGPTVTLAANVGVGVMFLSNVKVPPAQ